MELTAAATPKPAPEAVGAPPLVRVTALAKAFGPTQALRDCSFELRAGEVHALVGENGSGKSTLVKILSGVHSPDAGSIELGGEETRQLPTPRAAQRNGIVTVFQEILVTEVRSVLENLWLGVDGMLRTRVSGEEKRARATEALRDLLSEPLPLDTPVEELSLSDRQACCIARALLRRPRILILDEATSALDVSTRDRLFEIISSLRDQGVGVVFITHRLDEIREIGDRLTVMRSGDTVANLERGEWSPAQLVRLMTGAEQLAAKAREDAAPPSARRGEVVLRARGLRLLPNRDPVEVEVRAGELVGVAGLEGHGQTRFLEALWGEGRRDGEVVRVDGGREIPLASPSEAAANDVVYVPRERGLESLFGWMSIRENFGMPTLARDRSAGFLRLSSTRRRLDEYVKRLGIVLSKHDDVITTLSGGNQQKVVVARWLAAGPRVLLLNDPTRGIDIGAKRDLYELLNRLASQGIAVVMLSTETDEHVELMDRVLVFREHALFREIERESLSRESLVASFFGKEGEDGAGAVAAD